MSREYWIASFKNAVDGRTYFSDGEQWHPARDRAKRFDRVANAYAVCGRLVSAQNKPKIIHVKVKPRVQKLWIVRLRHSRSGAVWFWAADRRGAASKREEAYRFRNHDDAFAASVRSNGTVEDA